MGSNSAETITSNMFIYEGVNGWFPIGTINSIQWGNHVDLRIKSVIFNDPATIIYWEDGSKTVVKCQPGDTFEKEKGFMAAVLKKTLGNDNTYNKLIKKWCTDE